MFSRRSVEVCYRNKKSAHAVNNRVSRVWFQGKTERLHRGQIPCTNIFFLRSVIKLCKRGLGIIRSTIHFLVVKLLIYHRNRWFKVQQYILQIFCIFPRSILQDNFYWVVGMRCVLFKMCHLYPQSKMFGLLKREYLTKMSAIYWFEKH